MRYLAIRRDRANRICRVRVFREMPDPSIVWNRDDDYDKPKLRIGFLPWFRLSFYPGLCGPIRYTLAGRRGEIESWRAYKRRIGLHLAGLSEARLQAVAERASRR